ncbi:alpha-D-xyloside xylohydrolase [Paenibacillus sp. UNCCL117]|uniref:glycoside hydrolase family 31 protein n=1 Tax=unclassified Paenibacillus TaxID=185978 RepID=UPI0008859BED|nr:MULTISPECIES: TIM-barrel domain-containing protein [unclassified Paenibacillus]SDD32173.1 alpha-D-xyloside xylohydrolase [Paenibacillus sp. cl123]SFW39917.1 alpha-D-xyloside xylohydrolase [Paenibacillus sp. UNCCL117]
MKKLEAVNEMQAWEQMAPGIWRMTIGEPDGLTPLRQTARKPMGGALEKLGEAVLPFDRAEVRLDCPGSARVLSFPLAEEEALYGMGLQFMRMNQRGRTRYLRVNSDPKQDTGETHAPMPYYVSDRGYAVLVDTSRIVTVYAGSTLRAEDTRPEQAVDRNTDRSWRATLVSPRLEIRLPEEGADVYLFAGPTLSDAVSRYNLYAGGGVLPPKWGLGFWHRVPKLYSDEETEQEAMEFRKRGFPCDVIGLEPGWHSRSYPVTYEWDKGRFPDPARFVRTLGEQGFQVNLWEHPFVSPEASIYEKLKPLSGSHTVWGGLAPDYSLPEARDIYKKQHDENHVAIGVAGYKLDECDGSDLTNHSWMFPAHAAFPSGHDGEQMRQMYGLLLQQMTDDLYRSRNRRTYGLVRASGAAASSLPYVLYSDLYDHRQFVRALCNASFCGLLWTPEVRKADSAEEWVRRMQTVCFSPLAMLNAWGDGTKPWTYPEAEPVIRHYIRLRMRLLPYLYTAFAKYRFGGTPPFRPMPMAFSSGEAFRKAARSVPVESEFANTAEGAYGRRQAKEWDDQYMMGDDLVVAPVFAGEREREVLLPPDVWYGLETGIRYEGGQVVRVQARLEMIPLFVREGALLPTAPARDHAPASGEGTQVEWLHFGEAPGEGTMYEDDGESFDYEQGKSAWLKASVVKDDAGQLKFEAAAADGGWKAAAAGGEAKFRVGLTRLPEEWNGD